MAARSDDAVKASPWLRFQLREVIAHWNRALDAQDIQAMADVSAPGIVIDHEFTMYEGADALERFAAIHGSGGGVHRRNHVNHLQAQVNGDHVRARSMAMVTQLVPATSPYGAGVPSVGWVGWADDLFVLTEDGPRIVSRRLRRWGGDLLSRFPQRKEGSA